MAETITRTIERAIGYSGNKSAKSYIAQIHGTDKKYILNREFCDTEATDQHAMFTARRKRKGTWCEAAALGVGLYEMSQYGDRSYFAVYLKDGAAAWVKMDESRAIKMACLMTEGMTADEARIATKIVKEQNNVSTQ